MNREIKFRGKRFDNREWVYGHYVHFEDHRRKRETHRIYEDFAESEAGEFFVNYNEVNPDTIGQYTGENDVNNKPAYEGDLVRVMIAYTPVIFQVIYDKGAFCLADKDGLVWHRLGDFRFEVVGNRFDTPELLED